MITIQLYRYEGPKNVLYKSLTGNTPINGLFKYDFDISNPTLEVSYELENLVSYKNYCSVSFSDGPFSPTYYYYITDVVQKENKLILLQLHCDVLMTYSGMIEQAVMLKVATDVDDVNKLIKGDIPVNVNDKLTTYEFTKQIFDKDALTVILAVAGGDASI